MGPFEKSLWLLLKARTSFYLSGGEVSQVPTSVNTTSVDTCGPDLCRGVHVVSGVIQILFCA